MPNVRLWISLVLILTLAGCSKKEQKGSGEPSADKGRIQIPEVSNVITRSEISPNFSWKNSDGQQIDFDSFRGKVTLVNFWATWCAPCKHELPALIALSRELADRNVVILGIATDRVKSDVAPFVTKEGITYTVIFSNEELEKAFGNIRVIPTTFLIGADGKIANTIIGSRTKEQFRDAIVSLLHY